MCDGDGGRRDLIPRALTESMYLIVFSNHQTNKYAAIPLYTRQTNFIADFYPIMYVIFVDII